MNWNNVRDVSEDDESGRFIIITNMKYLQYVTESLVGKTLCYIIICSKQKCQDLNDWKIIIQQQYNDTIYLTLMKKVIPYSNSKQVSTNIHLSFSQKISIDENSIFIKSTNENYDLNIWKALEKYKSSNKLIYIISKSEPLEDIVIYVKNILVKYKYSKLR